MELPIGGAPTPSPRDVDDPLILRHAEFVQTMLEYICEGLACCPRPPDVDMGSLRSAVSDLAWHGLTARDVHLLHCIQRTCASYGFDTDGSLTLQRWGEELLSNMALTTQTMAGLRSEGNPGLANRLSLLSTTQVELMQRSPRFGEFIEAILCAAGRQLRRSGDAGERL